MRDLTSAIIELLRALASAVYLVLEQALISIAMGLPVDRVIATMQEVASAGIVAADEVETFTDN